MKRLVFLLFTTLALSSLAQEIAYVDRVTVNDRLFKGRIDDKYAISMYLKYVKTSEEDRGIYSVEGWYYYESIKKKIPVVGIFDGSLTVYVFKDQKKKDSVLKFLTPATTFWESIGYVKDMQGFGEKFTIESNGSIVGGQWETPDKSLAVQLDVWDFSIQKSTEYLRLKEGGIVHNFELNRLELTYSGYKVLSSQKTDKGIRVLLEYDCPSTGFVNGMCGAGEEHGFVSLLFDTKKELQELIEQPVESCLGDIWGAEKPSSNVKLRIFSIEKGEKTSTVKVDLSTSLIQVE